MLIDYQLSQTSIILRVKLRQDTTGAKPGNGKTALTGSSTGLVIGTIADNEASSTAYTAGGSTIQTIATLGTYAAPSASDCRFGEVDSTNHPGVYEIQLANARYAVSNAKSLLVSISGVSGVSDCDVCIPLRSVNPYDGVHGGMSALPNTACTTNASLLTSGTGTDQIANSAGKVLLQATQAGVTIPTVTTVTNQLTAAQVATGVWQDTTAGDFTVAGSIGKSLAPATLGTVPGASGGLFIAGTNAATAITTGLTAHIIGTVDTLTTYTGNTPQTGDAFARLGAPAGASIAADLAEIEAETDGIAAIPTNPYTGTPPTVAQIATSVWQDSTAGDFAAAGSIGKSLAPATLGTAPGAAGGFLVAGSNAATTFATLTSTGAFTINGTSDVAQTGDSFARIGAAGAGLTAVQLAAAGLTAVLVDGKTLPVALQIIAATTAGKVSGAGTGTEIFLGLDGVTTRVTATDDASGNRTGIVYG